MWCWQASNTDRYFAVTGHWIEESWPGVWEIQSALLGFTRLNNAHNGSNLVVLYSRLLTDSVLLIGMNIELLWIHINETYYLRLAILLVTMHKQWQHDGILVKYIKKRTKQPLIMRIIVLVSLTDLTTCDRWHKSVLGPCHQSCDAALIKGYSKAKYYSLSQPDDISLTLMPISDEVGLVCAIAIKVTYFLK